MELQVCFGRLSERWLFEAVIMVQAFVSLESAKLN